MTNTQRLEGCVCNAALNTTTGLWSGMIDNQCHGEDSIQWNTALYYATEQKALEGAQRILADCKAMAQRAELQEVA